jgi:hypothetical protein
MQQQGAAGFSLFACLWLICRYSNVEQQIALRLTFKKPPIE